MIYFRSDYSQGAHPVVMEALAKTNFEHSDGYGLDPYCERARNMIKELIGNKDCQVHFLVGGTPANIITITAALRPYEAVIAARSGHIYSHETGGVEANGHRIISVDDVNGKVTPEAIEKACLEYEDEHTVIPKMVYISNATENGSIYYKAELVALRDVCDKHNLYLYMDGARLGAAMTCDENDLSLEDIAALTDAFYIGGTKNGALFGEALVLLHPVFGENFRWYIKQNCGMLAKGRLLGVQFEAMLEGGGDSIYFQTASHANKMAKKLVSGLEALGCTFYGNSVTNQVFPIFPRQVVEKLEEEYFFYRWAPERDGQIPIRLVCSWGTREEEVDSFIDSVGQLIK